MKSIKQPSLLAALKMAKVESEQEHLVTKTVESDVDLDSDEFSQDDTKVNIAIFGKSGSGRTSFVNTIRGYSIIIA